MTKILRRLVQEPLQQGPLELRVTAKGHVLVLRAAALAQIRLDVLAHHKLNQGRDTAEKALLNALWRERPDELDLERAEFDELITGTAAFTMFVYAWWPIVTAPGALGRLADLHLVRRLSGSLLSNSECELLSQSYTAGELTDWTTADGALLDELVHLLGPVPAAEESDASLFLDDSAEVSEVVTTADRLSNVREIDPFDLPQGTYAHILVDEAQDITPMQWRMLRRRGPSASWTIVGDPAQSSWPDPEESRRALNEIVGTAPLRRFRMSTNYRSPSEVFDLAAQVVVSAYPEADLPKAVRSVGIEPQLAVAGPGRLAETAVDLVGQLLAQVDGTVGVIAPASAKAAVSERLAQAGLAGEDRIAIVTPVESKGLEYDGVLVVTPDEIVATSPGGVRALYVALTRPTMRLVTLDAAPGADWRRSLG
jgi:hypothetical protein